VLTLLHVLNSWKEQHIEILKLANSADASGDRDRVVGYLSAVVQGR
jgi:AmmeMemoRadiSam system protein B